MDAPANVVPAPDLFGALASAAAVRERGPTAASRTDARVPASGSAAASARAGGAARVGALADLLEPELDLATDPADSIGRAPLIDDPLFAVVGGEPSAPAPAGPALALTEPDDDAAPAGGRRSGTLWAFAGVTVMLGGALAWVLLTQTDLAAGDVIAKRDEAALAAAQAELEARTAAQAAKATEYGAIKLGSEPAGARVWLLQPGPAARFERLPAVAQYQVFARAPGHLPRVVTVALADARAAIELDALAPAPALGGAAGPSSEGAPSAGAQPAAAAQPVAAAAPGATSDGAEPPAAGEVAAAAGAAGEPVDPEVIASWAATLAPPIPLAPPPNVDVADPPAEPVDLEVRCPTPDVEIGLLIGFTPGATLQDLDVKREWSFVVTAEGFSERRITVKGRHWEEAAGGQLTFEEVAQLEPLPEGFVALAQASGWIVSVPASAEPAVDGGDAAAAGAAAAPAAEPAPPTKKPRKRRRKR